jgi:hypothetical protein
LGALTIAFDTIIVGALALPWVYLVIHLFFFEGENRLQEVFDWIHNNDLQAIAGILVFALAFTLGSAVSRIAQDFFNDDDLRIPWVFRMTMTEDRIIASVYCESDASLLQPSAAASPAAADKLNALRGQTLHCCADEKQHPSTANSEKWTSGAHRSATCPAGEKDSMTAGTNGAGLTAQPSSPPCPCQWVVNGIGSHATDHSSDEANLIDTTRDLFGIEENGLLLKGEDATLRLRQLHDQIMVLRGATFNGLIAFSLCLFAWGVKMRRTNPRSLLRWILALVPAIFLLLAAEASFHHVKDREMAHPPYMEFSLFVIGGAGAMLLWRSRPLSFDSDAAPAEKSQPGGSKTEDDDCFSRWKWGVLSFLFAVLFMAGVLGWWATEVLYAEQIVYSYNSQPPADMKTNK